MLSFQLCRLRSLMQKTIKIGTRGSKLALWQANWVKSALQAKYSSLPVKLITIKTTGDKIQDVPLAKIGGKGLFIKEIEAALLDDRVDIAVHSMKDMPSILPDGLCIGSIPEREAPQDVIISKNGARLAALESGARIGTGSLRRGAQLRHARPDITIVPLRGNLDTRFRKLETEKLDAIVVAAAGIKRLKLEHTITEYLDETIMLPAVGQGALCIEIRDNDSETHRLVKALEHPETRVVVSGERAFLNRLEGSCQVPVAGHGKLNDRRFTLQGLVANLDGTTVISDTLSGEMALAEQIGTALANRLLSMGADTILEKLKAENP